MLRRGAGEPVLDRLERAERPAELPPVLHVLGHGLQRALQRAGGLAGDGDVEKGAAPRRPRARRRTRGAGFRVAQPAHRIGEEAFRRDTVAALECGDAHLARADEQHGPRFAQEARGRIDRAVDDASGRGTSGRAAGGSTPKAPTSTTTGSRATSSMSNVAATGRTPRSRGVERPLASRVASRLALKNDRRPSTASGLACASSLPSAPRKAVCSFAGLEVQGVTRAAAGDGRPRRYRAAPPRRPMQCPRDRALVLALDGRKVVRDERLGQEFEREIRHRVIGRHHRDAREARIRARTGCRGRAVENLIDEHPRGFARSERLAGTEAEHARPATGRAPAAVRRRRRARDAKAHNVGCPRVRCEREPDDVGGLPLRRRAWPARTTTFWKNTSVDGRLRRPGSGSARTVIPGVSMSTRRCRRLPCAARPLRASRSSGRPARRRTSRSSWLLREILVPGLLEPSAGPTCLRCARRPSRRQRIS